MGPIKAPRVAWYFFPMRTCTVEVPTRFRSMREARSRIEEVLGDSAVAVQYAWEGEELKLSGAGAAATVSLRSGVFVGRVDLRPPASFFADQVRDYFEDALRRAASDAGAVPEEEST